MRASIVDQNGTRSVDRPNLWQAGRFEEWSVPFGRWLRTDNTVTIKPGENVSTCLDAYARTQHMPIEYVRIMIPNR